MTIVRTFGGLALPLLVFSAAAFSVPTKRSKTDVLAARNRGGLGRLDRGLWFVACTLFRLTGKLLYWVIPLSDSHMASKGKVRGVTAKENCS